MDEAILVSYVIDKLPSSWKYFKHTLKHKKEEMTLVELGSHLRIEESLKVQESDKPKSNNVVGRYVVNIVEHQCDKSGHLRRDCKDVKIGNKTNVSGTSASGIGPNNHLK
ncbi:hypothetical protein Tco_1509788, partial [Tanacetum coccineum]